MSEGRPRVPGVDEMPVFRKSSFSGGGGCVEVGDVTGGGAILRDTKDPLRSNRVVLDPQQWLSLLSSVRSGVFDAQ